jgi:hypothetical protein
MSGVSSTWWGGAHYSTEEQVVGEWIDGKPLYQKTVNCGTLPNKTIKTVEHNISNISLIVNVFGFAHKNTSGSYTTTTAFVIPLGFSNPTSGGSLANAVSVCANKTNIIINGSGQDCSATWINSFVTLQYTKTTD